MAMPKFIRMHKRNEHKKDLVKLMDDRTQRWGLNKATSYVSLGASDGEFDELLISKFMPNLQKYYAVDVDEPGLRALEEQIGSSARYKVYTHCGPAETWSGPEEKVDLVALIHMLYYVQDIPALLRKCATWLNDTGYILIVMQNEESFLYHISNYLELEKTWTDSTKQHLEKAGLFIKEEFCARGELQFTGAEIDLTNIIYETKVATEDQVDAVTVFHDKFYPGLDKVPHDAAVLLVQPGPSGA